MFYGVSHAPILRARGPSKIWGTRASPKLLGSPTFAHTQYEKQQPKFARWSN